MGVLGTECRRNRGRENETLVCTLLSAPHQSVMQFTAAGKGGGGQKRARIRERQSNTKSVIDEQS